MTLSANATMSDQGAKRFDFAIEMLLTALLSFMPLAFGVVHAWSEFVVTLLAFAIVLTFTLKCLICPRTRMTRSWCYVPVVLFLLLVVLQVMPLPASVVHAVSPDAARLWSQALGQHAAGTDRLGQWITLSLYPQGTRHDLRMLLIIASVFAVVMNVYRSMDQIKRLLGTVALVGGVVLVVFYVQRLTGVTAVYGLLPTRAVPSGPFVNHNHYCQFMNLSVAAALALIVGKLDQMRFSPASVEPASRRRQWTSSDGIKLAILGTFVLLALVSVALSLSRSGMIAALGGGSVVLVLVLLRKKKSQAPIVIAVLGLAAFGLVALLGFDHLFARFEGVFGGSSFGNRRAVAADLARVFMSFPLIGTGHGTHELVYPGFQTMVNNRLVQHADTDYFQLLAETGLAGIMIFFSFFIMLALAIKRVIQQNKEGAWICCALTFGIVAVLIHSLTDFGQRLPANACLTALLIGLIFSISHQPGTGNAGRKPDSGSDPKPDRGPDPGRESERDWGVRVPIGPCLLLMCVMVLGIGISNQAYKAWKAERHAIAARRIKQSIEHSKGRGGGQGLMQEYARLISHAQSAARLQPGHAHYAHRLNLYRWRLLQLSMRAATDESSANQWEADQWMPIARRIADDQMAVRSIAPTYGRIYELEGRIHWWLGQQARAASAMEIAYALGPQDPKICLTSGLFELRRGNDAAALSQLRRATLFDLSGYKLAIHSIIHEHGKPALALSLAGKNIRYQLLLAARLHASNIFIAEADQIIDQVVRTLERQALNPDSRLKPRDLAWLAQRKAKIGRERDAVAYYRRALQSDYTNVNWRLARARLLAKSGLTDEAKSELRICLRLKPRYAPARQLMASLQPGHLQR